MAPFDDACAVVPAVGVFTPVLEWHKQTWTVESGSASCRSMPLVVQLSDDNNDGTVGLDDTPDIVLLTSGAMAPTMLRAISGDGLTEIFNVAVPEVNNTSTLAAADIDGDQIVEIVAINSMGSVLAYEHDGTIKWQADTITKHVGEYYNAPAISDMDGDGTPEIIVGRAILSSGGAFVAAGEFGIGSNAYSGSAQSFAVDLDGDGTQEVVVGNAIYDFAGSAVWSNNELDGFPAIADLENDGTPEIIVATDGQLRAQSSINGSVLWTAVIPGNRGGPPAVADFDGDTLPEIGIATRNAYLVYDSDGSILWQNPTTDNSSGVTGSAVYDFEGDGVADVVYADEHDVWVFGGSDGTIKLKFSEHNSGTGLEYPVIADVDGDGEVEIVFCSESYLGEPVTGVTVLGDANHSWRPGRKLWNQHAYHITNVNDDGSVPAMAPQNWKTYNNFRSGDLSVPDGLSAPDLKMITPEICENTCADVDTVKVWIQLGNTGAVPLTAGVKLDLYDTSMGADKHLGELLPSWDGVLQPGEYAEAFTRTIPTAGLDSFKIVAAAKEAECAVDPSNEIAFKAPFCSPPG